MHWSYHSYGCLVRQLVAVFKNLEWQMSRPMWKVPGQVLWGCPGLWPWSTGCRLSQPSLCSFISRNDSADETFNNDSRETIKLFNALSRRTADQYNVTNNGKCLGWKHDLRDIIVVRHIASVKASGLFLAQWAATKSSCVLWAAKTAKIQLLLTNQSCRESINHFTHPVNLLAKLINLPNN